MAANDEIIMYSPPLRASFPHLNQPDEYKGKTEYKVKLLGDINDPEVKAFMKEQREVAKKLGFEKITSNVNLPMKRLTEEKVTEDEDGEEVTETIQTDVVRLIVKSKYQPLFVSASGKPIKNPPAIGEGSLLVAKIKCKAFEKGVACYLEAIQILEAVEGGQSRSGGNAGFGAREGYDDVIDVPDTDGGFKSRKSDQKDDDQDQDDDGGLEV